MTIKICSCEELPVKYFQLNGVGPIHAVYGSSSINFVEQLLKELAAIRAEANQPVQSSFVDEAHRQRCEDFDRYLTKRDPDLDQTARGEGGGMIKEEKKMKDSNPIHISGWFFCGIFIYILFIFFCIYSELKEVVEKI